MFSDVFGVYGWVLKLMKLGTCKSSEDDRLDPKHILRVRSSKSEDI